MTTETERVVSFKFFSKKFYVTDLPNEEWKDIPGYEDFYQASNLSRIKSLIREVNMANGATGLFYERVMKQGRRQRVQYPTIDLCKNGKRQHWLVHRLIALAWVPNPNNYKYVNHKDGNKNNNLPSNLEWCTSSQNLYHSYDIGLRKPLAGNKMAAKLNAGQVKSIRKRLSNGEFMSSIAKDFPVGSGAIWKIKHNLTW